jgi:ribosomal protein S27AE
VQSKNKKAPTVAEQEHIERIQAMECVVCDAAPPSEVHEIKQGQWFTACPLCPSCHRGSLLGLHGQRRAWTLRKLDEVDALAITVERLMRRAA